MPGKRRLLPREFSLGDAVRCWTDAVPDLAEDLARVKAHGNEALFKIDFAKPTDREALHRYRATLARFLMANPSGLFGKVILRDALKQVDRSILAGALTKSRPPDALANDSMRLVMLLQMVVGVNKAKTTGSRLPQWLLDLCGLLDASAVKLEETEEDRGDGQLDSEPNLPSSSRAGSGPRRLLKRLSSAPSEPAPNESQQKAARKPRSVDPVYWYSAATETAHKQVGGSKALASCSVDASDPSGFLKFTFPDGETWLSEVPCLDLVVFTRPAASISPTMRRPAGPAKTETHPKVAMRGPPKSSEWKLYHTKVYSDARTRYKRKVLASGGVVDDSASKAFARKECAAAKAVWPKRYRGL